MGRLHLLARSPQAHVIMRRGTAGTGAHGADVDKEPLPEGYQKGFDEGRRQSLAELEPRVRELEAENVRVARQLPGALSACISGLRGQAREEAVRLAQLIAEAVLRAEPCRRALLQSAVEEAMELLGPTTGLRLRVHPGDAPLLQPPGGVALPSDIAIVSDSTLKPGDAVLETPERGLLVASLPVRLEALSAQISGKLTELRNT
ncbi:MAG: hypothetical protein A3K19_19415 [Lentisphaerae bacterium RIFOXYB12_FULL_65_16]|nr:MAG: hypothetical protein A3K18_31400 [Lentisphaerae bacterium RIFOXYA12_64_32]OGV92031.1 MAG: hypothetical protein A3K19_19415 [Lentisphaerae bacterium RIFOXYB12_FULL_65_16]